MQREIQTDIAIIGAGTAGSYAMREVRRAKLDFVLIDPGPLGTTCARVGCMPSKVALHTGAQWAARDAMAAVGISGTENLAIDLSQAWAEVRRQRDAFSNSAASKVLAQAGERFIDGQARFIGPTELSVACADGSNCTVKAKAIIIANGSRPVMPAWLDAVSDRTINTDQLFELEHLPASLGILGLGAIGLEMGLAMARLGIRVVGADLAPAVGGASDPVIAQAAAAQFAQEFTLWLGVTSEITRTANGVMISANGQQAEVDLLLASLGRRPNTDTLALDQAGLPVDERGNPVFNHATMQIGDSAVFIVGDANADRPLMHEAADEGAMAGFNAAAWVQGRALTSFQRKVPVGIAFTAPDLVSVGARFEQLEQDKVVIGTALGKANGRLRILGGESSVLRVYADGQTGRLLGASMLATGGEHIAHLLAWAIQRGETAGQLLGLPFYHPVVEELLQSALQDIARQLPVHSTHPLGVIPQGH